MADPFTSWLWHRRNDALDLLHASARTIPAYAESPTQSAYLDRSTVLATTTDTRVPITEVVTSHPLASFCKIINVPHAVRIVQLKDLREPRYAHLQERVMQSLFSTISADESPHIAGHLAMLDDAFILFVPDGFSGNLQLGFLLKEVAHFHLLLLVGENATVGATIDVRSEHAQASYVQETILGADAKATVLVRESASAGNLLSVKRCVLHDRARVRTLCVSKAERTLLTSSRILVQGTDAHSENYALFAADGDGRIEQESTAHHLVPGSFASTLTRGTAAGASAALVRGVIRIEQEAHATSSHYEGKVLLLSGRAKANVLPTLQILTNDVSAKHGAAVGHVSDEELFYLMSRGLPESEAKRLLVDGFYAPILSLCTEQERDAVRAFFR